VDVLEDADLRDKPMDRTIGLELIRYLGLLDRQQVFWYLTFHGRSGTL
jgi:hypothetical protein